MPLNRKQRRARKVPAASSVSVLAKAPGVANAYYMALLDDRGKPFAQWGWDLNGWERYAARIMLQVEAYRKLAKASDPWEANSPRVTDGDG